jgi:hypothetical protein
MHLGRQGTQPHSPRHGCEGSGGSGREEAPLGPCLAAPGGGRGARRPRGGVGARRPPLARASHARPRGQGARPSQRLAGAGGRGPLAGAWARGGPPWPVPHMRGRGGRGERPSLRLAGGMGARRPPLARASYAWPRGQWARGGPPWPVPRMRGRGGSGREEVSRTQCIALFCMHARF